MFIIDPYSFVVAQVILPTISIAIGSGYAGSLYEVRNGGTGNWQADGVHILGATNSTYTMTIANEGKSLRWVRSDGAIANSIEMWVPSDGAGLLEWLDVRDASTLTLSSDGSRVTTIRSKVTGVARTEQTGSPYYRTDASTGLPYLEGAGDGRPIGALPFKGPSLFAVIAGRTGSNQYERLVSLGNDSSENDWGDARRTALFKRDASTNRMDTERAGSQRARISFTETTIPSHVVGVQHTPTTAVMYLDGVPDTSTSGSFAPLAEFDFTHISIMGATNFGDKAKGRLGCVVIYAVEASLRLRQLVEGFVAHTQKLTSLLPSNHPYKTLAPTIPDFEPMTVSVVSGSGYAGSIYGIKNGGTGNWQIDGVDVAGETRQTYVLKVADEGKVLRWKRSDGALSNVIEMWVPRDLGSNLAFWYDALDPAGRTVVSGLVSSFLDKSGKGAHLNQATAANRPQSAATEVIFNNTTSLKTDGNLGVSGASPRTMYVVGRRFESGVNAYALFHGAESTGNAFGIDLNNASTGITAIAWGKDVAVGPARAEVVMAGLRLGSDGVMRASLNGQDAAQTYSDLNTSASPLLMGYRPGQAGRVAIREALMVANALSAADEARLQGYLAWRNGLEATLPGHHPYRYSPPYALGGSSILILVQSGSGYAGSTYAVINGGTGKWQADGVDIAGATGSTYVLSEANEGKAISWLRSDKVASNTIEMWLPTDLAGYVDDLNPILANVELVSSKVSRVTNTGPRGNFTQPTAANQPSYDTAGQTISNGILTTPETAEQTNYGGFIFAIAANAGNISAVSNWPQALSIAGFDNGGSYTNGTALFAGGNVMRFGSEWDKPTQAAISQIDVSGGAMFSVYGRVSSTQSEISVNGEYLKTGIASGRRIRRKTVGVAAEQGGRAWQGRIARVLMGDSAPTPEDVARLQGWARWKYGAGLVPDHQYSAAGPRVK